MTEFFVQKNLRQFLIALLAVYWLVVLNILWFNNGGHGFDLPYNLVCWAAMAFMMLPVAMSLKRLRYSATALWLLAGAALMTLPVLWAPDHDGLQVALPRLTGLWGGVLFYFLLLQVRVDRRFISSLLTILAAAAVVESVVTLICIWWPQYLPETLQQFAREYSPQGFGVFEQRNVNASFLATGYTGMLALLAFGSYSRLRQCLAGAGVVFISATLILVESRIGWIGLVTGTMSIGLLANSSAGRGQSHSLQRWLVLILPLAGIGLGILLLNQSVTGVLDEHDGSNQQRMLVLVYTLKMIALHPIKGWGLGMYAGEFQRFMAALPVNPSKEIMGHPHNEILYLWFEGGIAGILGGVACVLAWIRLIRKNIRLWQAVALMMTLPVLLHTQVEYPFYFSVPHFMALLLLMRSADRGIPGRIQAGTGLRGVVTGVVLYGLILSMQCLTTGQTLLRFEDYQLENMDSIAKLDVPWLMKPRLEHDMTLLRLVRYKRSRDKRELVAFVKESERFLKVEPDATLMNMRSTVESYLATDTDAD